MIITADDHVKWIFHSVDVNDYVWDSTRSYPSSLDSLREDKVNQRHAAVVYWLCHSD